MNISLNTKRVLIYIVFVIVAAWAVALVIYRSGLMEDNLTFALLVANYIIILTPALGNIFTRLVTKEGWENLWMRLDIRRGWKFYLAAWLLPLLAISVGGGIFYLLFPQSFDPNLGEVQKIYTGMPEIAENPWLGILIYLSQALTLAAVVNGIVSLIEEVGWRGYLLPKLVVMFSGEAATEGRKAAAARAAAVVVGLIWGVWHYPLFFLASGSDPSVAFPFPLLYLVSTCAFSVLLSWVTLRTGSVWPASLGHGMINSTSPLPGFMLKGPAVPLVGPGVNGVIGMLGYIILALALLIHPRAFTVKPEESLETPAAQPAVLG